MRLNKHLVIASLLLVLVLLITEYSSLDLWLEDSFFNPITGKWLVDAGAPVPRFFFYTGAKGLIILFGVALLAFCLWPKVKIPPALRERKRDAFFLLLCLGLVPFSIGELKANTDIYCPYQLSRYGGNKPYMKLFGSRAAADKDDPGKCYPAGHASGGFALMSLFFVAGTRRGRAVGMAIGQTAGWTMGLYQMVRGAHFLSHTIVTMLLAWILIVCLTKWVKPFALRDSLSSSVR